MNIGFLGPIGSFSYTAVKTAYGKHNLRALPTIIDCLEAAEKGLVTSCLVPIENSTEGSVTETLDYLYANSSLQVVSELVLPIKQYLFIHPQNKNKKVTKIFSHPQAIAQSHNFLRSNYPEASLQYTSSTASAAEIVANNFEKPVAAIGSQILADIYDLEIKNSEIQDLATNNTRFWLLGAAVLEPKLPVVNQKTSLILTMPKNSPGILHSALSSFAWRNINLTKIESRPMKTVLGEYFFLIDCLTPNLLLLQNSELELKALGAIVKNLGTYQVYSLA